MVFTARVCVGTSTGLDRVYLRTQTGERTARPFPQITVITDITGEPRRNVS